MKLSYEKSGKKSVPCMVPFDEEEIITWYFFSSKDFIIISDHDLLISNKIELTQPEMFWACDETGLEKVLRFKSTPN